MFVFTCVGIASLHSHFFADGVTFFLEREFTACMHIVARHASFLVFAARDHFQ